MLAHATIPVLADVAVVAKHLESRRISPRPQIAIEVNGSISAPASIEKIAMHRSVFMDMVDRKHRATCFSAAATDVAAICEEYGVLETLTAFPPLDTRDFEVFLSVSLTIGTICLQIAMPVLVHLLSMAQPFAFRAGTTIVVRPTGIFGVDALEQLDRLSDTTDLACPMTRIVRSRLDLSMPPATMIVFPARIALVPATTFRVVGRKVRKR